MINRVDRLNSLLKEVIAEVVAKEVRNPKVHPLVSITQVDVSKDLHNANVYISVIGTDSEKEQTVAALQSAAGFISVQASKKVKLRYFPHLYFRLDGSVEKYLKIDQLIEQIQHERDSRPES